MNDKLKIYTVECVSEFQAKIEGLAKQNLGDLHEETNEEG
jgi:hypothetical protein